MDLHEIRDAYPDPDRFRPGMDMTGRYCVGGALVMARTSARRGGNRLNPASFPQEQRFPDAMDIAMQLAAATGQAFTDDEVEALMGCSEQDLARQAHVSIQARALVLAGHDIVEHNDEDDYAEAWRLLDLALQGKLETWLKRLDP